MNTALSVLYHEHDRILKAISRYRAWRTGALPDEELLRQLIRFFRGYADGFHHRKEEEWLFPLLTKTQEQLGYGIVQEMLNQHDEFRDQIREAEQHLDRKETETACKVLDRYTESLTEHIAAENEELFPAAERLLGMDVLLTLGGRFRDVDQELGEKKKQRLELDLIPGP